MHAGLFSRNKEFHHCSRFSDGHGRALDHLWVYDLLSLPDGRAGCLWFHDQEKACVQLQRWWCRFVVRLALYFSVLSLYAAFLQFTSVSQINMRTLCSGKFEQRRGDGAALPRAEGYTCTKLMLCSSSHSHAAS